MSYKVGVFDGRGGALRWLVGGVEYRRPRIEGAYTLLECFEDYIAEHCVRSGGDPGRAWIAFNAWIDALGFDFPCAALTRADGRKVENRELARGVTTATVRKHLTMGLAALNHAKKEERIAKVPKLQMPAAAQPRVRWLTREEHQKLMVLPKPWERQMFWQIAFGTGARTRAILELTWDRVDLERRTIDFRVPGKVYKNKRRAVVPITDSLLVALQQALPNRIRDLVIHREGQPYSHGSNYHECKADLALIGINERGVARHVARHTVATWMLRGDKERGIPPVPIHRVAMMLGDTIAMVERTYAHVLPTDLQDDTRVLH